MDRVAGETSSKDAPEHYTETHGHEKDPLTQFLGWFSIGLGVAELVAPQAVARLIGVDEEEHTTLLRAYGVREIAAGLGILTRPKPTYWMWNRVIGDTVDLASLARAMRSPDTNKTKLTAATIAVLGVTALDILCSVSLTSESSPAAGHDEGSWTLPQPAEGMQQLSAVVTVNKPVEEVYAFWKDPQNLPQFMESLESVRITSGRRSHWKAKGPAGMSVEWDAETITDTPNEMIMWSAVEESEVENMGTVRFTPAAGGRGTEVSLEMEFKPRGGIVGEKVAKFFEVFPKTQLRNDLRRFKQLMEIGEIVKSDSTAVKGMQPARPPKYTQLEG
ncbi:MAG TPA: SRPBCC family protein [Gemmatimonadaceae bacterium]|nr:SRPBCC family protein [Gemmatimonadaceae bacterium]